MAVKYNNSFIFSKMTLGHPLIAKDVESLLTMFSPENIVKHQYRQILKMVKIQKEAHRNDLIKAIYINEILAQQEYNQRQAEIDANEYYKNQHDRIAESLEKSYAEYKTSSKDIYLPFVILMLPDFSNLSLAIAAMIHKMSMEDANKSAKEVSLYLNTALSKSIFDEFGVIVAPRPSATVVDVLKHNPTLASQLKTEEDLKFHNKVHANLQDAVQQIVAVGKIRDEFRENGKRPSVKSIVSRLNKLHKKIDSAPVFKEARDSLIKVGERELHLFHEARNVNKNKPAAGRI